MLQPYETYTTPFNGNATLELRVTIRSFELELSLMRTLTPTHSRVFPRLPLPSFN